MNDDLLRWFEALSYIVTIIALPFASRSQRYNTTQNASGRKQLFRCLGVQLFQALFGEILSAHCGPPIARCASPFTPRRNSAF